MHLITEEIFKSNSANNEWVTIDEQATYRVPLDIDKPNYFLAISPQVDFQLHENSEEEAREGNHRLLNLI